MASLDLEEDDREKQNEDAQTKRIKEILVELLVTDVFASAKTFTILEEKDAELGNYSQALLKEVGRRYYLDPPLLFGRLYVKERFWAQSLLEIVDKYQHIKKLKKLKNICIIVEAIRDGRSQFQNQNLSETVFNDADELQELREHLWFFLASHQDNGVSSIEAFDKIAKHAARYLHSDWDTDRAQAGNEKYAQLVQLFQAIRNIDDFDAIERLTKIRALIIAELEADPDENNLISNRGGFFGAYKTMSKCLNKLGFLHYSYKGRTAISTTDHLLIELVDTINEHLMNLGVEDPDQLPRVEVL